ncbi:MAG: LytTR family DNA-binding domain-containing protein [Bacteroidota bacterium]
MQIKCIIAEDEPLAMERARQYVQKIPFLELTGCFENAMEALVFLKTNEVDLLFLDINMGEFSGIQLLELADLSCEVIFTTAYHEYALKGFDLNITDYLLKPYTFERFLQAVSRAQANISKRTQTVNREFIFIKTEFRLEKIMLDAILFIEGMRDYRRIHMIDKKIMTLKTFADLEREIVPGQICRIHKSYMVSLQKIDSVEKDRVRIKDHFIPISETYKKAFFELIRK